MFCGVNGIRRHLLLADQHFHAAALQGLDEFRIGGLVGDEATQFRHPGEEELPSLQEQGPGEEGPPSSQEGHQG